MCHSKLSLGSSLKLEQTVIFQDKYYVPFEALSRLLSQILSETRNPSAESSYLHLKKLSTQRNSLSRLLSPHRISPPINIQKLSTQRKTAFSPWITRFHSNLREELRENLSLSLFSLFYMEKKLFPLWFNTHIYTTHHESPMNQLSKSMSVLIP